MGSVHHGRAWYQEGIEDHATASALRDLGCDLGQGFHYARPVSVADLLTRLAGAPAPGFTATLAGSGASQADRHAQEAAATVL